MANTYGITFVVGIKYTFIMAKPIKETPVLRGKDASNFHKEMKKSDTRKVLPNVKERMLQNFDIMNTLASI